MTSKVLKVVLFAIATVAMAKFFFLFCDRYIYTANDQTKTAHNLQAVFGKVIEKGLPSVVIVRTSKKHNYYSPYDEILRKIYGLDDGRSEEVPFSGQDSDGYIVTNYHMVKGQDCFDVLLKDGTECKGKLLGVDPKTDLAVLKINVDKKFPFLKFADSERVQVDIGLWA